MIVWVLPPTDTEHSGDMAVILRENIVISDVLYQYDVMRKCVELRMILKSRIVLSKWLTDHRKIFTYLEACITGLVSGPSVPCMSVKLCLAYALLHHLGRIVL